MGKLRLRLLLCFCAAALIWSWSLLKDRQTLNHALIRFHVVANSDTPEDQAVKLQVRDAVVNSIRDDLARISDVEEAKQYLKDNLPKIERISNQVLEIAGVDCQAVVTLCKENFNTRVYDTFSLPAGIYDSLRIVIGEGNGQNWWCVAFPDLCIPSTSDAFEDAAVGAGFSESLSATLSGKQQYQVRFFLLDCLGEAETDLFGQ